MDTTIFTKLEVIANLLEALAAIVQGNKMPWYVKLAVKVLRHFVKAKGDKYHVEAANMVEPYAHYDTPAGMTLTEFTECLNKMRHYQEASLL